MTRQKKSNRRLLLQLECKSFALEENRWTRKLR